MMLFEVISVLFALGSICPTTAREPLAYAPEPENIYIPPKPIGVMTLLDFIKSRDDLTMLASALQEPSGFAKAFDTPANWKYTFFAPSNFAFNNTGQYFNSFIHTPKGKWWFGNLLTHHYVPNSILASGTFNSTVLRFQTGSYLYISGQKTDTTGLVLNGVSKVTTADLPVTNGVVHIIDRLLDPSAQIFEADLPNAKQGFIPGSCSNVALPYC